MKTADIKKAVYLASGSVSFNTTSEMLMTCCILYKFIEALLDSDSSNGNSLKEIAKNYINIYRMNIEELKRKYISYKLMENIIEKSGKTSFITFPLSLINRVYTAYGNHTKIAPFSISQFSQYTYQVNSLDIKQAKRLEEIHNNVMAPIAKYYYQKYGVMPSKLQIFNAEGVPNNPGKEILFIIEGIPNNRILEDILSGKITDEYYSATLKGDYVRIITK